MLERVLRVVVVREGVELHLQRISILDEHRAPCARPARGSGVPRAAFGEYGVLIGRESAHIAASAGKLRSAESAES